MQPRFTRYLHKKHNINESEIHPSQEGPSQPKPFLGRTWRTALFGSDLICSGVPPDVALVIAQAASFLVLNSAFCRISIRTGKMLASMTVCGAERDRISGGIPGSSAWMNDSQERPTSLRLCSSLCKHEPAEAASPVFVLCSLL